MYVLALLFPIAMGRNFEWALAVRVGRNPSSIENVPQKSSGHVVEGPWKRLDAVGDTSDISLCVSSLKGKQECVRAQVRPERRNRRRDARKKEGMQGSGRDEGKKAARGGSGRSKDLKRGAGGRGDEGGGGKQRKLDGGAGGIRSGASGGGSGGGGELPGVWGGVAIVLVRSDDVRRVLLL